MEKKASEKLALLGGEKAVKSFPEEKWKKINDDVKKEINKLLDAGICSIADGGGVVGEFESAFAKMSESKYALAMCNGTSTLHSAFFAVGAGPGTEVIVPTYTWHASITPVLHCSATPVFCDIEPNSLTIDPDDIERKITPRTKAVCVVHVWGNVCDMDKILKIVKKHKLALVEDCSHAHGAKWKGRPVGSLGDVGCFSMQGAKAVSGGEAGVAITNNPDIYDRMVLLGHFSRKMLSDKSEISKIGSMSLGAKYRPHPWAIAMALVELKRLPELNMKRTRNYAILNRELKDCPGIELVEPLPGAERGGYLEFKFKLSKETLKFVEREKIVAAMKAEGVPISADRYSSFNYTYGLLHAAPLFNSFDRRSIGGCFYDCRDEAGTVKKPIQSLPVAEDIAQRLISSTAFIEVPEEALVNMAAGMKKVMRNLEDLKEAVK